MSTARKGTRKIRPEGAPKLGETYRDWRDFTDRVARPWLDNDGADVKVDAWHHALMLEADPWYLACALVIAANQIDRLKDEVAWWQMHAADLGNDADGLRAEVDRLRTERADWIKVARIGRGPERYVRFSPDYTEPQRRLAAEAFGIDLDEPWHDCHPDAPGSNGCRACTEESNHV